MANHDYFAILYVFDKDGEFQASMPCRDLEEVMLRASKYPDYVRVVPKEGPHFLIKVKDQKLNGHTATKVAESNDIKVNGHCPHHYDGTGSLIHDARPPIQDVDSFDYWKSKSNKTKF